MMMELPKPGEFANCWSLDPKVVFLNHGSFGACPAAILQRQDAYRRQLESQPIRFLIREMEQQFNTTREKIAAFVNAPLKDLVFVQNATTAVNTVFRSLKFDRGDEIVYTNHIYAACKRVLDYVAETTGAVLVEASFGFPIDHPGKITDAILAKISPKTKIVLIDHISSATALIHPVEEIVGALNERGIDTLIDGAHALGSIPLDLQKINATYYTANCHKWLCAPKSSAILYVRSDKQDGIVPAVISHPGHRASSFTERFYWPGTYDPSAVLAVSDTLDFFSELLPGGFPEAMQKNHELCLAARNLLCERLNIPKPCPDDMIASMATIMLPVPSPAVEVDYKSIDPLQESIFRKYHLEVPVWSWSFPVRRLTRISAQRYNSLDQYRYLADVLQKIIEEEQTVLKK